MNQLKRTAYCGLFRKSDIDKAAVVSGFVQRRRALGGLIFITLRDRTGIIQLTFDESVNKELFDIAYDIRNEFVITAKGKVVARGEGMVNADMDTGEIEISVSELIIHSKAETPPFEILEDCATGEELRLKYRYLDLRRPNMQKNIMLRHKAVKAARDFFDDNGFIEIETPMLIKATPEGARDYLVPSRLHHGKFYALPQSPQIYKQLLMVSGFDRYVQFAHCFRDEDLRADRQPEFTQIDFEMSFVDTEDVLAILEGFVKFIFKKTMDIDINLPIRRMPYKTAMEAYGSDKPDLRYGLEIINLTDIVKDSEFKVFADAASSGSVRAINVKDGAAKYARKEIDKLTEFVKGCRAGGLAWYKQTNGEISSSFAKFLAEDEISAIKNKCGFEDGDLLLIIADKKNRTVLSALGSLRCECAKKLELVDDKVFEFVLITEFPFLDFDEDIGEYVAMHHPFTCPMTEDLHLLENDPGSVRAKAYDVVLNGIELGSGSIRISDDELQQKMFKTIGLTEQEANEKFGFLLEAFKYGVPPHGGFAFGLDRLMMLMLNCSSIREVIAFPKVQNASELMSACPANVSDPQLEELYIKIANLND